MAIDERMEGIEAVFLDLDGTIYLGGELIEGACEFLDRLDQRGVKRFFLSNNSSRSVSQYLKKLTRLGIPAREEEILLSTHDLLNWLEAEGIDDTFLVGTQGMGEMLEERGIRTQSKSPQAVVLGYDTEITYQKLSDASMYLHAGVPLVASHPDLVCPSPVGGLPDVGAFLSLFETTTGVKPVKICGKPNPSMILGMIGELGLGVECCAMIGDRIYTDMAMADASGVHGILVLSREATAEDAATSDVRMSLVAPSVDSLCR